MTLEICLLGSVEALVDGTRAELRGEQPRRLVAYLALSPGVVRGVDGVIEALWPGDDIPVEPRQAIHTYVSRLRAAFGTSAVVGRDGGYALEICRSATDLGRFEALVDEAGDPGCARERVVGLLSEALRLWRGPALEGFECEAWARPEAARVEEMRCTAIDDRAQALLDLGRESEAVADLEAAAAASPLRERTHGLLMTALSRSGRQAEALRAFQRYRRRLATDLGLEPGAEIRRLEMSILAASDDPADGEPGRPLRGYVLGERIGDGAFAVVYKGTQPAVGREVAIKVVRAELANRPEFIRRFETEAHLVARLEHPHIVPLYDYWREPGSAYLVMRLLRGGTLEHRIAERRLTADEAMQMASQVGTALTLAHNSGVVHRDVKSANVFLDESGNYFLGDFGIAFEASASPHSIDALSVGSPAYASPEQLRREPVGPPADVHGLGITLFEALTGELPFPGARTQAELLRRQLHDPLPSVTVARPDLGPSVDVVLAKATAKDPTQRYPMVDQFVADFCSAVSGVAPAVRVGTATVIGEMRNPFKGLRAFQEADATDFHGRQRLIDRLVEKLAGPVPAARFVTVVGPSGSGKSSVVRAGLLPAIRAGAVDGSQRWFVTSMLPGAHPFEEMEAALNRIAVASTTGLAELMSTDKRGIARAVKQACPVEDADVVLLVDQFEELFTLCPDEKVRQAFIGGLVSAVTDPRSRLRVVTTLRADFYDRPLRYPELAPLIEQGSVTVSPLAADELDRAITEPAARVGATFEPGLVARIIADVVDQPGALPLLQYALTELYDHNVSGMMTGDAYDDLGGLSGALARRAEQVYANATEPQQESIRRVFSRLVTLGEGTEDTRRRVKRSEFGDDTDTSAVIDAYGAARLLAFDRDPATREPTVEVAHEALIREWPRLRAWLDDNRSGLRLHRHLTTAATAWQTSGRDVGELYRGGRLEAVEQWMGANTGELNPAESEFVAASLAQRAQTEAGEQRSRRRIHRALAAVAVVAVVALLAGAFAWNQRRSALDQRRDAQLQSLAVQAVNLRGSQRDLAALLAVEAYRRSPDARSKGALWSALTQSPSFVGYRSIEGVSRSLRGSLLAGRPDAVVLGDSDRLVRIDIQSGVVTRTFEPLSESVGEFGMVRSSADGHRVAQLGIVAPTEQADAATGLFGVYDADTGELVVPATRLPWAPNDAALSPDGRRLAAIGGPLGVTLLYAVPGGELLATVPENSPTPARSSTGSVAFAPDGRLFIGSEIGDLRVVDPDSYEVVRTFPEQGRLASRSLTFSPDGSALLAINAYGGQVSRVDPVTGELLWGGQTSPHCGSVVFGRQPGRFYCAETGIGEYDLEGGQPTGVNFTENATDVSDLAVTSDGNEVVSFGGILPIVARWRIDGGGPIDHPLTGVIPGVIGYLPTGELIVGDWRGADLVDASSGALLDPLSEIVYAGPLARSGLISAVRVGPGGEKVSPVVLYDTHLKRDTLTIPQPPGAGATASISPNERWLHLGRATDSGLDLWRVDLLSGQFVDPVIHVDQRVNAEGGLDRDYWSGITNDGRTVFIADTDGLRRFDLTTGNQLGERLDVRVSNSAGAFCYCGAFAFRLTDKFLITGETGIVVRDVTDLSVVATMPGAGSTPFDLTVSADGSLLQVIAVNTTTDASIALYDLETFTRIGEPVHIAAFGLQGAISPDGLETAVASDAGTHVWDLDPEHWATAACSMAGRNLTRQEWDTYLSWAGAYRETCPTS